MSTVSSQPPIEPASVRRALVIRPRFLGDVCITLPVVEHLHRLAPGVRIDYLVEPAYGPLLEGDPRIDRVLPALRTASPVANAKLFGQLHAARYDLVLDLFCNPRTAFWTMATGARTRVGYPGKGWRSGRYNRFARPEGKSAVQFHLASIRALGWETDDGASPRLEIPRSKRDPARARLRAIGVPEGTRIVILHPGAAWPTRRWQPDDFAEVASRVVRRGEDHYCLLLAGPGEEDLAGGIVRAVGHPRCLLAGGIPVGELAAFLAGADAFAGGDSGPIHVSVATGTPTVAIFGRNEPATFFPYPSSLGHRAVYTGVWCSPCHLDVCSHNSCLHSISPDLVWEPMEEILSGAARAADAVALEETAE